MKSPWVFFFVWKEVFPWTTCFSPNHPTHCYTTWHTYFLDTMSYPRSSCRPVAWKKKKKVISNAWHALLGKDWIETGFLRATVGKDKLLVHFFHPPSSTPLLPQVSCFLSFVSEIMLKAPYWKYILQLHNLESGKNSNGCHPNWEDNDVTGIAKEPFSSVML